MIMYDIEVIKKNYLQKDLFKAVNNQDILKVKQLINKRADINASNLKHESVIYTATILGDIEIVKLLIAAGANVEEATNLKEKMLALAIKHRDQEFIKWICNQGVNVNFVNEHGETPLHLILATGLIELLEPMIIKLEANVNATDSLGKTALHWAQHLGLEAETILLCENGANINMIDNARNSPLHLATLLGLTANTKYLLNKGADIGLKNLKKQTPVDLIFNNKDTEYINDISIYLLKDCGQSLETKIKHYRDNEINNNGGNNEITISNNENLLLIPPISGNDNSDALTKQLEAIFFQSSQLEACLKSDVALVQ